MAARIVVIDYHKGNLQSMARGLALAGGDARVSDDPAVIASADALVLPGVGAFADAMAYMRQSGQADAVVASIDAGKPFLGVCLGMQLLFGRGNETAELPENLIDPAQVRWIAGLGVMAGEATRLVDAPGAKVPHMGWNSVDFSGNAAACPLLDGLHDGEYFYFTHSYVCRPADAGVVVATTRHSETFTSMVWDGRAVFGCQFHPEKSSGAGAVIMRNFVDVVQRGGR